jgi:antitoxin ParD1/3/4
MGMTSVRITLPEPLKAFVEAEVTQGGYGTPSEYIRSLLHEAQQRKAADALDAFLLEGFEEAAQGTRVGGRDEQKRRYRARRLKELRKLLAIGVEQLDRGEGIPAEEVFRELRERNRRAARPAP